MARPERKREEREEVDSRGPVADLAGRLAGHAERDDPIVVRDGEEVGAESEFAGRGDRHQRGKDDDLLGRGAPKERRGCAA